MSSSLPSPKPLSEAEVDTLLRKELTGPQPSSAWRNRVLAATLRAAQTREQAREQAREIALQQVRLLSARQIAAERKQMLQRVLVCVFVAVCALALLPALVDQLTPAFGSALRGVNGLSLVIAAAAFCAGMAAGFPGRFKELVGL